MTNVVVTGVAGMSKESELSEEEKAAMHGLICKLQKVVQENYSKYKKK